MLWLEGELKKKEAGSLRISVLMSRIKKIRLEIMKTWKGFIYSFFLPFKYSEVRKPGLNIFRKVFRNLESRLVIDESASPIIFVTLKSPFSNFFSPQ
jgi:hypothetical protein